MKEATGELNLTVIVVMAVAILVAFFYYTIWPSLNNNFKANSSCSKAVCENPCKTGKNTCEDVIGKMVDCELNDGTKIQCPWKG